MDRRSLVSIVDASYRDETSFDRWGEGVLDAANVLDSGAGVAAQVASAGAELKLDWFRSSSPSLELIVQEFFGVALRDADGFRRALANHRSHCTFFGKDPDVYAGRPHLTDPFFANGFVDVLGVFFSDGEPQQFQLYAPLLRKPSYTRSQIRRFQRVGIHVSAGYRATKRRAAAILSATGKLLHPEEDAQSADTHDALRRRVISLDRARARAARRADDGHTDELLAVWKGLLDGEWSLVDRFDTDGKRFVLAKRNAPRVAIPGQLTPGEKLVVALAAQSYTTTNIAYALGLSQATVSTQLHDALPKLGLKTRADLIELFTRMTGGA